jgi:hypothetical protein
VPAPHHGRGPGGGEARDERDVAVEVWAQLLDLQLPGLRLHLRQEPSGPLPGRTEDPPRPHAIQAQGDQASALSSSTRGRSRMRECRTSGSVRGRSAMGSLPRLRTT